MFPWAWTAPQVRMVDMSDLCGRTLKDYRVLRRLGRGAMAEVFLAEQSSLGRQVALKVLNVGLANDPNYVQRFHQEARAAAALIHAGIVQIYEVGQAEGFHFIAQEYVSGRNLGELILRQGRVMAGQTLDILRQVTAALQKASEHDIVHRDIKPENIMLASSGEVKVADFGLARVQGEPDGTSLTQAGVTMGTPLYMSPEQIEGKPLDSRSDIYSLGVTAYHMLSGRPPFEGDTPLSVAVQHLNQSAEPLQTKITDLPGELARVVHCMLAKKAADRYANPAELLAELRVVASQAAAQGWGSGPYEWSTATWPVMVPTGSDSTRRLSAVMKASTRNTAPRFAFWKFAAVVFVCFLIGGWLALISRPRGLLAGAQLQTSERKNVAAQLYHAKRVDTEAAWLAIPHYFPEADVYELNLARQGLVRHYFFVTEEFAKAARPLKMLRSTSKPHDPLNRFALAGLTIISVRQGNFKRARQFAQQITSEDQSRLEEEDPRMAQLFREAQQKLANQR